MFFSHVDVRREPEFYTLNLYMYMKDHVGVSDTHTGVMRLWNVSKSTPIENIRLKKTGFHALHVFSTVPLRDDSSSGARSTLSSTSEAVPAISPTSRYALPPAHAVCTFLDGGVGLYDLGKRKWNFLRDQVRPGAMWAHNVPTPQGKQGKWPKKNPCQGKHREFENMPNHREFGLLKL